MIHCRRKKRYIEENIVEKLFHFVILHIANIHSQCSDIYAYQFSWWLVEQYRRWNVSAKIFSILEYLIIPIFMSISWMLCKLITAAPSSGNLQQKGEHKNFHGDQSELEFSSYIYTNIYCSTIWWRFAPKGITEIFSP